MKKAHPDVADARAYQFSRWSREVKRLSQPASDHLFHPGIFDQLSNPVLVTQRAGSFVDANPAFLNLLGYAREELSDLHAGDLFASGREWLPVELEMTRRREGDWRGVRELRRKDGSTVVEDAWSRVVPSPEGPIVVSILRQRPEDSAAGAASIRDRETVWPLESFHLTPRICIIDDDKSFLRLCAAILGPEGIDAEPVVDLDDALDHLDQLRCDLLLVDIRLGQERTGLEVAAAMRESDDEALRTTPMVLCTASRDLLRMHADLIRSLDCGVIEKPFDLDEFVATLTQALREPRERLRRD